MDRKEGRKRKSVPYYISDLNEQVISGGGGDAHPPTTFFHIP